MKIGLIGLGKMGGNMRQRLRNKGIEVVGYARSADSNPDVASIKELVEALPTPRIVWVMVPHGKPTDAVIDELEQYLATQPRSQIRVSATWTVAFQVAFGVSKTVTA